MTTDATADTPFSVKLGRFIEVRSDEIAALLRDTEGPGDGNSVGKLTFQTLPRHMKRRAMSYDSRRVPRRLREQHKRNMERNDRKERHGHAKPPSRKHRRRPGNLLAEYNRRQRKHVWLETHIWHAKRFRLAEKWGYRVPVQPNGKHVRSAYRAISTQCIMQDVSYYSCLDLAGPSAEIFQLLLKSFPANANQLNSQGFISGAKEITAVLYKPDCYPRGAVASVQLICRPRQSPATDSGPAQVWITVHPTAYQDVIGYLVTAFGLTEQTVAPDTDQLTNVVAHKLDPIGATKQLPRVFNRTTVYSSPTVTLTSLKDTVNRFRLNGPTSGDVVAQALQPAGFVSPAEGATEEPSYWWQRLSDDERSTLAGRTVADCSGNGSAVATVVRDPRLTLPKTKTGVKKPVAKDS